MPPQRPRIIGGRTRSRPQVDVTKVEGRKPVGTGPTNRNLVATPATRKDLPRTLRSQLKSWPKASREAAYAMIDRYGIPIEATPSHVVWYKNGPWKRTTVWRDGHDHEFPALHTDVLEQVLDFEPPMGKFDELAKFNGSLTLSRTRGELSSRCDTEETNFLMANLANDIATEVRTNEEARAYVAEKLLARRGGEPDDYLVGLQFAVDLGDVGDPDDDVVGSTSADSDEMARDAEVVRRRAAGGRAGRPGGTRTKARHDPRRPSTL